MVGRGHSRRTGTPTEGLDGTRYRSKFEALVGDDLIARGVHPFYETERIHYMVPRIYVVDFAPHRYARGGAGGQSSSVINPRLYIEAKGYFPVEDRRKVLDFIAANQGLDFRLLFQRASTPINKGSKTTYAAWAQKHGIPWAEGLVPEEWLK